ncbi:hypothetical protein I7I53_11772 [Histoplasma capsulatum var. duboisii H88]|uniref:Uncharacterized protein n=1 Tax=Ajellomyces capsulatus (strain H88) TaxID=544711 RepID=A0A8A1LYS3_AJEC8|nr:hypothetical protein I7I53_11772 [Histoplasma capsulatum var. duboisii H88]
MGPTRPATSPTSLGTSWRHTSGISPKTHATIPVENKCISFAQAPPSETTIPFRKCLRDKQTPSSVIRARVFAPRMETAKGEEGQIQET